MRRAALGFVIFVVATPPRVADGQEAIYVVRHAERADTSADSPLSTAGEARSRQLASWLHDAGITRIFTTELRRTIQTAAPLAETLHLTPTVVKAGDTGALMVHVGESTPTDRLLIVGHSNTVPELLRAVGVVAPIVMGDSEYDNLFIVIPVKIGPPVLLHLRF